MKNPMKINTMTNVVAISIVGSCIERKTSVCQFFERKQKYPNIWFVRLNQL